MGTVGEEIKRRRMALGISQNQLAKRAGIAQATLSAIEKTTKVPNTETLKGIAIALGCTVAELLGENTADPEDDAWAIRERLRRDPNFRMLFSAASKATPEHLLAAAFLIKQLENPTFPEESPQEFLE